MTISTSTSNLSGSPEPSIREKEQTAATEALKLMAGLSILKDTLEIPFSQLGGQIGRYPANPGQPTLPPLISTRGPSTFDTPPDSSWKEMLSTLIDLLPDEIRGDYLAEMALPVDQRNINFMAFDNVLIATAQSMSWLQEVSGPSMTEGVSIMDKAIGLALPHLMLSGVVDLATNTLKKTTDFLDLVGANYQQTDAARNTVRLISDQLSDLADLREGGSLPTSQQYSDLSNKLSVLSKEFERIYTGDDLSILGDTLKAMASLTAAMSFIGTGNPVLYLSLTLSSIGLESPSSASSIVGPAFASISNALASNLSLPANPPVQSMLGMLVSVTLLGSIALATTIRDIGLGYLPAGQEGELEAAKTFSFELGLLTIVHSGALDSIFTALTDPLGLTPNQQKLTIDALSLISLTTMILSSAKNQDPEKANDQFDFLQGAYEAPLNRLSQSINDYLLIESTDNEIGPSLAIALQEARIALSEGNMENFVTALFSPLEALQSSREQFMADMSLAKTCILGMSQALTTGLDDKTNSDTRVNLIA